MSRMLSECCSWREAIKEKKVGKKKLSGRRRRRWWADWSRRATLVHLPASFLTLVTLASVRITQTQRQTCTCSFLLDLTGARGHESNLQNRCLKGPTIQFSTTHKPQAKKIPPVSNQHLTTQIGHYEPHRGRSYCRDALLDCERKSRSCFVSHTVFFINLVVPFNTFLRLGLKNREHQRENHHRESCSSHGKYTFTKKKKK